MKQFSTVDEVLAAHFTIDEIKSLGENGLDADWEALRRDRPWHRAYPADLDSVVADVLTRSFEPLQSPADAA
jgi:hypothetical protein